VQRGFQSYGANQWPAELPQLPAVAAAYIEVMRALAQRLMGEIALALDLPATQFDAAHGHPMITLRWLRYPPHPEGPAGEDARLFGAGAHTDWGAVTILAQDGHGGLEVCMPDGRWIAAPPLAGSFVVNLGDMMPRWTNGRFHSNPHRVRNRASGGRPRYSIPFFYSPDYLTRVEPLPGCVGPDRPARHPPCTVGEHLRQMYELTYGRSGGSAQEIHQAQAAGPA
jgi:isopenicillin N synthase-like dioxygenase